MEQLAEFVPMVQVLDAPGFLGEVGVVDLLREIDAPALDELVIAVPKISLDRIPQRCPRRRPRKAEQLVEVPTILSYSSLQRAAEQTIDIPVPASDGGTVDGSAHRRVLLHAPAEVFKVFVQDRVQQRFVEQNSSTFQFLKVVEVWAVEVYKVSPRDRAQQRFMEQITLVFQFLLVVSVVEVFKASSQDRVQLLLHLTLILRLMLGKGFFALFPGGKKCGGSVRTRGQNWVRTLLHGLRRLMPSPWLASTTWLRSRRRRRRPWRGRW